MHTFSQRRIFTSGPAVFQEQHGKRLPGSFLPLALLISLGLLLVSAACAPFSRGSAADQAQPGAVLFSDDFSNPPSGWGIWKRDGASVDYYNHGLRILVNQGQYDFWSVAGQAFADARIEVDATKVGGPNDNDFGLICRYVDKDNFYMLVISSDGYYGIAKMNGGEYSMIGADQLQYSDAVARGQALNRLRADCLGSTLTLYANGQKLMQVQDEDFRIGDVGVLAGSYDEKGVEILFDNFLVKKP